MADPGAVAQLGLTGVGLLALVWANQRRRPGPHGKALAVATPGWIARRRARGGVRHPSGGAALGYRSAWGQVALSPREFALGGLGLGAPGSGKTTLAALLIQALAVSKTAGVILDPKPSRLLAETVAAAGGTLWTLGGQLAWDALPDDPSELAAQLVEVEPETPVTRVYHEAARFHALKVGQLLQRQGVHPTLERVAELMRPGALSHYPEAPKLSQTEWEGVKSFGTSLRYLANGAAGRSLGVGATGSGLRLEDEIAAGRIVLFQLDSSRLPEETRQTGAWVLRAMLRLLRTSAPCWLIADEFARLGWQGRHALELLALGREFHKPVVLLSQGPSDFRELGPHALDQVAQEAAWVLAFRQGTRDSDVASRLLGVRRIEQPSWPGKLVEQPIVPASVLENLEPGTGLVRVPPVHRRRARVEAVRVAWPHYHSAVTNLPSYVSHDPASGDTKETPAPGDSGTQKESTLEPPDARIVRYSERTGGHWVWRSGAPVNPTTGYPRLKISGKYQYVHIVWWEHVHGPRPKGEDGEPLTVDHCCEWGKRCVTPNHKRLLTRGANSEDRWQRERGDD